jgi:hypothetical protein
MIKIVPVAESLTPDAARLAPEGQPQKWLQKVTFEWSKKILFLRYSE